MKGVIKNEKVEQKEKKCDSSLLIVRLARLQSTIGKAVEQKLILTLWRKCTLYPDLYLSNADKQFLEMKCCSGETFKGKFINKILAAKKFSWISYTLTII